MNPKSINTALQTLKLMPGEAVRGKLLKANPCLEVKELRGEDAVRVILTVEEARKLFPWEWATVRDNNVVYKARKLAACTRLRIGELRGLRGEYVLENHIHITGQYTNTGYVNYTKTKHSRYIPVSPVMRPELEELLAVNGEGYVFSEDGGKTPVTVDQLHRQLDRALKNIGISYEEKRERNLTFHSWRHFLNTLLRMSNVADSKVQAVTGHLTKEMTDHYTHFDTRQFAEVRNVQTELLTFKEPEKTMAAEKATA